MPCSTDPGLSRHAGGDVVHWSGLRFEVPRDWWLTRYGLDPDRGSLTWVDRRRQRLQLHWVRCGKPPDLTALTLDVGARERVLSPDGRVTRFDADGPWRGWVTHDSPEPGRRTVRAVRYDVDSDRLLEAVVLEGDEAAEPGGDAAGLLRRIEAVCPPESSRRWRAFQLDVRLPEGWRLSDARVLPTDVTFTAVPVNADAAAAETRIRRRGMAEAWYHGDHERYLREQLDPAAVVLDRTAVAGWPAVMASSDASPSRARRWLGRGRERCDLVWLCPPENALYQVTSVARTGHALHPRLVGVPCAAAEAVSTDESVAGEAAAELMPTGREARP